ncbi:MAG: DUF402 domain-containing protein [Acidimicrobiia bacterium]
MTLVPHHGWWCSIWNESGSIAVYVDMVTPPEWHGDTVRMIDLDLDVVLRSSEGEAQVVDEDEFDEHRRTLAYPQRLVDGARAAAGWAVAAISGGREPFGSAGPQRLEEARAAAAAAGLD